MTEKTLKKSGKIKIGFDPALDWSGIVELLGDNHIFL